MITSETKQKSLIVISRQRGPPEAYWEKTLSKVGTGGFWRRTVFSLFIGFDSFTLSLLWQVAQVDSKVTMQSMMTLNFWSFWLPLPSLRTIVSYAINPSFRNIRCYCIIYKVCIYFIYSSSYATVSILKRNKINRTQRQIYKGRCIMGWACTAIKWSIHTVGYLLLVNKRSQRYNSVLVQRLKNWGTNALVRVWKQVNWVNQARSRERWMFQTKQSFSPFPFCSLWTFRGRWLDCDRFTWLTIQNANAL